jgi:uncharacterized membrane protein
MSSSLAQRAAWLILVVTILGTVVAYPSLPPVMATHFGMNGQVNGSIDSLVGAFTLPLVMLLVLLLCTAIPHIDPMRINIQSFRRQFDMFVALLMLFFAVIQTTLLSRNLGVMVDPMYVILPAVGILIFYLGTMLPYTKRNWFIGIRTPWTISSDHVWKKTHELGGTLFKVLGVIIVLGVLAPQYALGIILVPLIVIAVGLVLYSYFLYEQDRRRA